MSKVLESVLAQFEGAPIVEIFGVVPYLDKGVSFQFKGTNQWNYRFEITAWHIANQELQTQVLKMRFIGTQEEIESLAQRQDPLQHHQVFHFKARVVWNPAANPVGLCTECVGQVLDDELLNHFLQQVNRPAYLNSGSLPTLTDHGYGWNCALHIPYWDGFSTPSEEYEDYPPDISNGVINVGIETLETSSPSQKPHSSLPTPAQIAALNFFVENQAAVSDTLFQAIYDIYPEWRGYYYGEEEYMPEISSHEELKSLMRLTSIYIPRHKKDGMGYVYFHFTCHWDPEHGFNAVTHKSRLVFLDYSEPDHAAQYDAEHGNA